MSPCSLARRIVPALLLICGATAGCGEPPTTPTPTPAPLSVAGIAPASGSTFGQTVATISGAGFQPGVTVTVDGVPIPSRLMSAASLSVTMPPHGVGQADVAVINPSGERATLPGGYAYVVSPLKVFRETATGFATTDLRDSQEQIVQINAEGQLIFTPSGAAFPAHAVTQGSFGEILITPPQLSCDCVLEVRFGTEDGERRAYLTAEYGHHNPGTLVDIEVVNGLLTVGKTNVYPPGSFSLSGQMTEMTDAGPVPVAGAGVAVLIKDGWRESVTDSSGSYSILGLYDGSYSVSVVRDGYETSTTTVTISGNTRFDARLRRR